VQPAFNLARLDLVSMRLIISCGTTGSLSAAALQCHMSLMGASERLWKVEDLFGKRLFHRHRRGLTPTEAGKAFIERSENVLAVIQKMAAEVQAAPATATALKENCGRRGNQEVASQHTKQ
jgi:DNA-binding transcriptional LysR family regulator